MAVTSLTETEANVLFDILVANAGHNDDKKGRYREEFVQKFTDGARYHGENWFSGEYGFSGKFVDFKLIAENRGSGIHWKLIKQMQPARQSPAALALTATNEALMSAYATGTLNPQRWIVTG